MEGRLTAYDAAFEAQNDDDDEGSTHVAPALYLEDNRYDPARLVEKKTTKNKVHLHYMMR
jgi:RNA polymerase sigma-32 factor